MRLEFSMSFPHAALRVPRMTNSNPFCYEILYATCLPHAPCTMRHLPFSNCQLPIETETVNMAPSACRSISQATVDAKIDAKSMPDFVATVVVKAHRSQPAFWAVTYGTAKVPQGATLVDVRPCVARNPKLA